jgi:hypothetical protein
MSWRISLASCFYAFPNFNKPQDLLDDVEREKVGEVCE